MVSLNIILLNAFFAVFSETFSEPYSDKPQVDQLLCSVFSEYINLVIDGSIKSSVDWASGQKSVDGKN